VKAKVSNGEGKGTRREERWEWVEKRREEKRREEKRREEKRREEKRREEKRREEENEDWRVTEGKGRKEIG
jgi:hypothetical protein